MLHFHQNVTGITLKCFAQKSVLSPRERMIEIAQRFIAGDVSEGESESVKRTTE